MKFFSRQTPGNQWLNICEVNNTEIDEVIEEMQRVSREISQWQREEIGLPARELQSTRVLSLSCIGQA